MQTHLCHASLSVAHAQVRRSAFAWKRKPHVPWELMAASRCECTPTCHCCTVHSSSPPRSLSITTSAGPPSSRLNFGMPVRCCMSEAFPRPISCWHPQAWHLQVRFPAQACSCAVAPGEEQHCILSGHAWEEGQNGWLDEIQKVRTHLCFSAHVMHHFNCTHVLAV